MATNKDYLLPDLGEGLTEGEIVSWLVAVGDTVALDQPVAEIETAKAVVEVPSPFAGTVTKLFAKAGEEVEVGKPLMTIDVGDGSDEPTPATEDRGTAPDEAEVSDMVPEPAEAAGDDGGSGNVLVG
ncbi:MAG: biotin/lipoyl-containing protein, partial [Egibacteraceae bacterium]